MINAITDLNSDALLIIEFIDIGYRQGHQKHIAHISLMILLDSTKD